MSGNGEFLVGKCCEFCGRAVTRKATRKYLMKILKERKE